MTASIKAIKAVAITDFMPPITSWGKTPVMSMPLGDLTALVHCADGSLLSVLHLDCRRMLISLAAGTLWQQLMDLKMRSPWAYLILSDCPTPGRMAESKAPVLEFLDQTSGVLEQRKWTWPSYQGALMTAQELGVIVLQIPTEADLGPAVLALGARDRQTKRVSPVRGLEAQTPAEALLLALPDIGEARMLALLHETDGNAVMALMILTDDSYPFPGIGQKTRLAVRAALGMALDQSVELRVCDPQKAEAAA